MCFKTWANDSCLCVTIDDGDVVEIYSKLGMHFADKRTEKQTKANGVCEINDDAKKGIFFLRVVVETHPVERPRRDVVAFVDRNTVDECCDVRSALPPRRRRAIRAEKR